MPSEGPICENQRPGCAKLLDVLPRPRMQVLGRAARAEAGQLGRGERQRLPIYLQVYDARSYDHSEPRTTQPVKFDSFSKISGPTARPPIHPSIRLQHYP